MKDIKIIVATHKSYNMPGSPVYVPVHVGAEGKVDENGNELDLGYIKDNTGENISDKNASFCELTGLYWAWKNLDAEYIGLAHYRRHFAGKGTGKKFNRIIGAEKLDKLLDKTDVLLPKKRNYVIETNRNQYLHAHHSEGLTAVEEIIKELYPDYLDSFNRVMDARSGHRFNMLIMKKSVLDDYCTWLFDILFKAEEKLDISEWTKSEQRVYGYLSERLLDVWLIKNDIKYKEIPYVFMEKQNWLKKGWNFIKRKFKANS